MHARSASSAVLDTVVDCLLNNDLIGSAHDDEHFKRDEENCKSNSSLGLLAQDAESWSGLHGDV